MLANKISLDYFFEKKNLKIQGFLEGGNSVETY